MYTSELFFFPQYLATALEVGSVIRSDYIARVPPCEKSCFSKVCSGPGNSKAIPLIPLILTQVNCHY